MATNEVQYYGLNGCIDVRIPEEQVEQFESRPNFAKLFTRDPKVAEASAKAKQERDAAKNKRRQEERTAELAARKKATS